MINFNNSPGRFFVQTNNDNNSDFVNRQKNVFEKLDAVINSNETSISKQNQNKRNIASEDKSKSFKKQKLETRQFRGQESIFKRPEVPPPSRFQKNLPDFLRHPEKWTKYTLSDVSQDDMSDHTNTAAAMSFLRELRAKKEAEDMDVDGNEDSNRPTFKKPRRKQEVSDNEEKCSSQSFKSSKVVMPEYVVGGKKLSTSKKQKEKPEKGKEIKLDHLEEEEEDGDF